jgi:hypothetical protein
LEHQLLVPPLAAVSPPFDVVEFNGGCVFTYSHSLSLSLSLSLFLFVTFADGGEVLGREEPVAEAPEEVERCGGGGT